MHWRSTSGTSRSQLLCRTRWESPKSRCGTRSTRSCAGRSQQHVGAPEWIDHRAGLPYLSVPNVFTTTRHNLYKAADQSRRARPANHPRHGDAITHDDLVAHVMFGTWANLLPEKFDAGWLDPNGHPVQNQVNLQARRDLWRNCLHGGFPNVQHDPRGYGTGNKVRDLRKRDCPGFS